jgi:transmembrane sensor
MSNHTPDLEEVRLQAARWVLRLDDGDLGDEEFEELYHWLMADPVHERELLAARTLTVLVRELPDDARSSLIAATAGRLSRVVSRRLLAVASSLLLAIVAIALGVWLRTSFEDPPTYATAAAQTQDVRFPDGSIAHLNTRTRLQWDVDRQSRRVILLEGEALFDVARDRSRPFRVVLDSSEIRVVGTRFNVYRKSNSAVVVTVLEGTVEVQSDVRRNGRPAWKRELHANQQIVYRPEGLLREVHQVEALDAVKWRDGVLQLENEPLREVLTELARYTDKRIVIRDPRIADLPIGGSLSTRDVRLSLQRLQVISPMIRVTEHPDGFELSLRASTGDVPQ